MTSTTFPFLVGVPGADKTIPFRDAEFRFTTKHTRKLEDACGGNIDWVIARGQSVKAMVLMVCYGLLWQDKQMTEDKAADLIDEFIDAGGDVIELSTALYKALGASGVYGKPKKERETDPLETTPGTTTGASA
jgi:hypothetical protein